MALWLNQEKQRFKEHKQLITYQSNFPDDKKYLISNDYII